VHDASCGCETWWLTCSAEHWFVLLENTVLREMFVADRKWWELEKTAYRKLHTLSLARQPLRAMASSLKRFQDPTQIHHCRRDSSGRMISPSKRKTRNPSKRGAQTHVLGRAATGICQFGKYISGDEIKESERGRAWGRCGGEGNYIVFCSGHLGKRGHVEDLGVDGTIIFRWFLHKWDGNACTGLIWLT
jgi:hypothetical protein